LDKKIKAEIIKNVAKNDDSVDKLIGMYGLDSTVAKIRSERKKFLKQ